MTHESIQPFLDWISVHPTWSGFIVFLISLSESLAIVGLLVPGVVMMTAIGGMMGSGILPFWETLTWAILGAVAGDGLSYWLGYHYHEQLREFWPFRKFPKLFARGEAFFRAHGGKSIVFGRFVGPVRPMIPVIAGMMDMLPGRFFFFNVLSAIAWAPLYSLPGILIGASLGSLSPEVASRVGVLVLLLLLIIWVFYEIFFLIGSWLLNSAITILNYLWRRLNQLPGIKTLLKTAQGTEQGQLGLMILFFLSSISFLIITFDVINSTGISDWNEPVYQALRALYSDHWISIITLLTGIGDPGVLIPTALAIGLGLIWSQRLTAALCWFFIIGLGYLCGFLVKDFAEIPRPEGILYLTYSYAYPSNHCLGATLVLGFSAFLIQRILLTKYRWIPFTIAIPLILAVTFSRLYLGTHWFTDILGSLALGTAFVSLGGFLYRRLDPQILPIRALLIPGLSTLTIAILIYSLAFYPTIRKELVREWPIETLNESLWWKGQGATQGLYRTGALKHQATIFDIQWLGSLKSIQNALENKGWTVIPKLSFKSGVLLLADNPAPLHFPVMPKFHRDRLPVIAVAKPLTHNYRLVLQIWQSDYKTEQNESLWVGTLRLEVASHPLPLTTLYLESPIQNYILKQFEKAITTQQPIGAHFIFNNTIHHPVLLLKSLENS